MSNQLSTVHGSNGDECLSSAWAVLVFPLDACLGSQGTEDPVRPRRPAGSALPQLI
jgi:hypothetical protein